MHSTAGHDIPASTTTIQSYAVFAASEHLTSARANAPYAPGAAPQRKKPKPVIKTQLGKQLSKSLSTPQLRGPIMSDSEDKRRNKLGYQRISIACAHCRRRKIRCLLAEDDNEQRCQNCIRLKKECVFYPVDQQAAMDARSEASNKTGGPSASSTVPSSPSQMGSRVLDQPGHHFGAGFQNMPSDGSQGFQGIPIVPSITIPPQGNYAHPDLGFPSRGGELGAVWSPQEFGTQSPAVSLGDHSQMPQRFTRYGHPNMTADTAPYPGSMDQSPQHIEGFGYASAQHWQSQPQHQQQQPPQHQVPHQPVRSMSYPNNYTDPMYSPAIHQSPQTGSYIQPPPFQQYHADPQMVTMAPGQAPFVGSSNQYMMSPDQRSSSIPNHSPFHPPQQMQAWYSDAAPYASVVQETHTLPSQKEEGGYPTRSRPG